MIKIKNKIINMNFWVKKQFKEKIIQESLSKYRIVMKKLVYN